jgi:2-dehydro-3-deoxyphosphogluconate aldolase/(4S)-4-hydroxy-2-oxoglutarate aldolase
VGIKFIPTGGISADNLADYLRLPMVHACGGSFMVKKQLIAEGQFEAIRDLAETAVTIVQSTRSEN